MTTLLTMIRHLAALMLAALISYSAGSAIATVFILESLPVNVPLKIYLTTIAADIRDTHLYFIVIALGFLIAFPIAALLRKALPKLAKIGYPLAGAAAIGSALGLMFVQFEQVPITGADSGFGFICQMFAGALGGFIFETLSPKASN